MKVSNPDFDRRVNFAASRISSGHRTTRAFDSCFEMNDGEAVALALYLRAQRQPHTKLAQNISRYIVNPGGGPMSLDDLRRFSWQLIEKATAK